MAYATVSDLMLGDIALGTAVSPEKYLQEAEEDVDIALGQVYAMPYDVEAPGAVPHTVILLRRIVSRLASGRLILAQAIGGEDRQLQAYGKHLIDEAEAVIHAIVNGTLDFEGPEPIEGAAQFTGPSIVNYDAASAVDTFYETFMGPAPAVAAPTPIWRPGG